MGKLKEFEIVLTDGKPYYQSGAALSGQVNIMLTDEMKIRSLKLIFAGQALVRWSEQR